MAEAVNSPDDLEREPDVGPVPDEQPNAPYLEAVVAYAFRGPGALPRAGPQGRPGRRPGRAQGDRRSTRWRPTCRRTSTGSTSGRRRRRTSAPSGSPPRRSAPSARGSSRTARPRATTRSASRSRRSGTRIVAQRNSHASIVDGLVLSGGIPSFVAPEYDAELGITHASRPTRSRRRCARRPTRGAAFIVSPTYYGMAADVAGLAEVAHARRRAAGRRPVLGPALRLPRGAAADRALAGRRRDAHEHAQDRRLADPERDAARRPLGATASTPAPSPARIRLLRSTSPSSLLLASLDGARRQLALHGEQLLHETLEAIARRAREARDDPRHRARRRVARRADGHRRLRPAADRRRRPRDRPHRLRDRRRAAPLLRRPPRAADPGDARVRRRARRVGDRRCGAWRATSTRPSSGRRPGTTAPIVARRRRRCATRSPSRRARRSSARPSSSRSTTRSAGSPASRSPATRRASRRCCRASASRPRPSPTCASWRRAARACTARATRGSRPSTCSGRSDDRSPRALGRSTARSPISRAC